MPNFENKETNECRERQDKENTLEKLSRHKKKEEKM